MGLRGFPGYGTFSAKTGTVLGKLGHTKTHHPNLGHSLSELKFNLQHSLSEAIYSIVFTNTQYALDMPEFRSGSTTHYLYDLLSVNLSDV